MANFIFLVISMIILYGLIKIIRKEAREKETLEKVLNEFFEENRI